MAHSHEEELARELTRRGLSRREVLKVGLRLGLGATSMGALLAACGGAAAPAAAPTAAPAPAAAAPTAAPAPAAEAPTAAPQTSLFDASEGADAQWPQNAVADPTSPVELSVAHAWDATFFERQKQFDELFTKRHPNITIKAENTPWGDFRQKYLTQAAGNALPDIIYVHFSWAQDFAKSGILKAVDDYIAKESNFHLDDFVKSSLPSYQRDGKLWVVPYDEGPGVMYYNKDIFDKAGIKYPDDSWTLDTLRDAAIKMTSGEGPTKIFGLAELPSPGNSLMAPSYLFPFGAQYLSEPKEDQVLINKPEAVTAMEWWEEMRGKGADSQPGRDAERGLAGVPVRADRHVPRRLVGHAADPAERQVQVGYRQVAERANKAIHLQRRQRLRDHARPKNRRRGLDLHQRLSLHRRAILHVGCHRSWQPGAPIGLAFLPEIEIRSCWSQVHQGVAGNLRLA